MQIDIIEQSDDLTHLALAGRLDVIGAEDIGKRFDELVGKRGRNAVIDLSGVHFVASMGLGLLLKNANALAHKGRRLVLLSPEPLVEEVLRMAGLDQVTPVAHDLDEALALVGGGGTA